MSHSDRTSQFPSGDYEGWLETDETIVGTWEAEQGTVAVTEERLYLPMATGESIPHGLVSKVEVSRVTGIPIRNVLVLTVMAGAGTVVSLIAPQGLAVLAGVLGGLAFVALLAVLGTVVLPPRGHTELVVRTKQGDIEVSLIEPPSESLLEALSECCEDVSVSTAVRGTADN